MSQRLEFGWILDNGRYICDGCNVRDGHMHRCHHNDGAWADGHSCDCTECQTNPTTLPSVGEQS